MSQSKITKERKRKTMERMRREGVWKAACEFRAELRNEGKSANESWTAMEAKFPPLPTPEPSTDLPDLDGAGGTEDEDIDVDALMDSLGTKESDYFQDIQWVYENFGNTKLLPESAPSLGALNLLNWARRSQNRFFEQVLPKAMAARRDQQDDEEDEDLCDQQVRKLLIEIQQKGEQMMVENVSEAVTERVRAKVSDWDRRFHLDVPVEAVTSLECNMVDVVNDAIQVALKNPEEFKA